MRIFEEGLATATANSNSMPTLINLVWGSMGGHSLDVVLRTWTEECASRIGPHKITILSTSSGDRRYQRSRDDGSISLCMLPFVVVYLAGQMHYEEKQWYGLAGEIVSQGGITCLVELDASPIKSAWSHLVSLEGGAKSAGILPVGSLLFMYDPFCFEWPSRSLEGYATKYPYWLRAVDIANEFFCMASTLR
ncbi:hypothetical protein Tco_1212785 [Tanacetum coccineum]